MWLFTPFGFYSAVQHREDNDLVMIRARAREDLEHLQIFMLTTAEDRGEKVSVPRITETPEADYRYRFTLARSLWAATVQDLANAIDYPNFKDAVAERQGQDRAHRYNAIWRVMYGLQLDADAARSRAAREDLAGEAFSRADDWDWRDGIDPDLLEEEEQEEADARNHIVYRGPAKVYLGDPDIEPEWDDSLLPGQRKSFDDPGYDPDPYDDLEEEEEQEEAADIAEARAAMDLDSWQEERGTSPIPRISEQDYRRDFLGTFRPLTEELHEAYALEELVALYLKALDHTPQTEADEEANDVWLADLLEAMTIAVGRSAPERRVITSGLPAVELEVDPDEAAFIAAFNAMAERVHDTAVEKGWWDKERNDGEVIALMHSELSEALEALRHGNPPDDKIPAFTGAEAELADVIIRIMDMGPARRWRIAEAIVAKAAMNRTRPRMHGGKRF